MIVNSISLFLHQAFLERGLHLLSQHHPCFNSLQSGFHACGSIILYNLKSSMITWWQNPWVFAQLSFSRVTLSLTATFYSRTFLLHAFLSPLKPSRSHLTLLPFPTSSFLAFLKFCMPSFSLLFTCALSPLLCHPAP